MKVKYVEPKGYMTKEMEKAFNEAKKKKEVTRKGTKKETKKK